MLLAFTRQDTLQGYGVVPGTGVSIKRTLRNVVIRTCPEYFFHPRLCQTVRTDVFLCSAYAMHNPPDITVVFVNKVI